MLFFSTSSRNLFLAIALLASVFLSQSANAITLTVRPAGSSAVGFANGGAASEGSDVDLEVVLDTNGLSLEGYSYGISISGGTISGIAVNHRAVSGLIPDAFAGAVINDAAGTVRNVNQASFSSSAPAGVLVIEDVSFRLVSYNSASNPMILVTLDLFGEVFGVGGGTCPGTVGDCSVEVFSTTLVPEPAVSSLLGAALVALLAARRRGFA